MRLNDYYKKLSDYFDTAPIIKELKLDQENDYTECVLEQIPEILMPATSYLLAPKPQISDMIESSYADLIKRSEKEKKEAVYDAAYQKVNAEELESFLSLRDRIKYRQLMYIMISGGNVAVTKILKMMKRCYPSAVITGGDPNDTQDRLALGMYDTRHAYFTYVSMILSGARIYCFSASDQKKSLEWMLRMALMDHVGLPHWEDEHPGDPLLGFTMQGDNLEQYFDQYILTKPDLVYAAAADRFVERYKKQQSHRKQAVACMTHNLPSLDELMKADPLEFEFKAENSRKLQSYYNKITSSDIIQKRLDKIPDQMMLPMFLWDILKNAPVCLAEVMSRTIPLDTRELIETAYTQMYPKTNISPEYYIAGGMIYTLASMLHECREENDKLTKLIIDAKQEEQSDHDEELVSIQSENDKEKHLSELALNGKNIKKRNKELSDRINTDRKVFQKEKSLLEQRIQKLEADLKAANTRFDNLYDTTVQSNDDDDDNTGAAIQVNLMCAELQKEKLIFVGGHDTWRAEMQKYFPNMAFINKDALNFDGNLVKKADYIIYNVKWNQHGMYYKCLKYAKSSAEFIFLNTNNITRTIDKMYKEITTRKDEMHAGFSTLEKEAKTSAEGGCEQC